MVLEGPYAALVLNPAGPFIELGRDQIKELSAG
jgi:hypothetical protein